MSKRQSQKIRGQPRRLPPSRDGGGGNRTVGADPLSGRTPAPFSLGAGPVMAGRHAEAMTGFDMALRPQPDLDQVRINLQQLKHER